VPTISCDPAATQRVSHSTSALTNSAIAALKPGGVLRDDRVPGLMVRARANSKSFHLYYRTAAGEERRPKIGDAARLGLSDARDIARRWLAQVANGGDPSADRKAKRHEPAAPTMDDLWQRCLLTHYNNPVNCEGKQRNPNGNRYHDDAAQLYRDYIKLHLGGRTVRSITVQDVQNLMDRYRHNRPIAANRAKAVLSKMLKMAIGYGWRELGPTPCSVVNGNKERHRRRYANRRELEAIGAIMNRFWHDPKHKPAIAYMFVMAFTGARPTELGRATPQMVEPTEGGAGILRIPMGKNGEPRDVHLPPQAMRVLAELPQDRTCLVGMRCVPHKLWKEIVLEAGCPDLWFRDFRRTFSSVGMSRAGLSKDIVGGLLSHKSEQTTAIYAKLMEDVAADAAAATASQMERMLLAAA
jgi:integrase